MKVEVRTIKEFDRRIKRLSKKYRSIGTDLATLLASLEENPLQGADLGMGGARKVRMAIMSKGGGKSGGARVITYVVTCTAPDNYMVTLLTIYDKSETENVNNEYIKSLIDETNK